MGPSESELGWPASWQPAAGGHVVARTEPAARSCFPYPSAPPQAAQRGSGRAPVPFIAQDQTDPRQRTCGAAALGMVYASLGLEVAPDEIWRRIARPDGHGARSTRTYLLAADALARGLAASIVQVDRPIDAAIALPAAQVRVILNHRLDASTAAGHYSVLVDATREAVVLHDPQRGGWRRLQWPMLLDLWCPSSTSGEVAGGVLVAIAPRAFAPVVCSACERLLPTYWICRACGYKCRLQPAAAIGCVSHACRNRTWRGLFCTMCDTRTTQVLD